MPDLTMSLAILKGQSESLKDAKGEVDNAAARIGILQVAVALAIAAAVASLQGLDTVGLYSSVDQLLRLERFAGKSASVDYIKANPTCTEQAAEDSWTTAALVATGLPVLVVPVASYAALYRANLLALGLVPDLTYESQRAWIVATPKAVIMGA